MLNVLITRPEKAAQTLATKLNAVGIDSTIVPCITIIDDADNAQHLQALERLRSADIIVFLSQHAVNHSVPHWPISPKAQIICVGHATQAALSSFGYDSITPHHASSEGLLAMAELQSDQISNKNIIMICGHEPRVLLAKTLKHHGAHVTSAPCYTRQCPKELTPCQLNAIEHHCNMTLVTSKSTLDHLLSLLPKPHDWLYTRPLVVVSERLHQYAKQRGFTHIIQSADAHNGSIVEALVVEKGNVG